jgi:hypothetical protein
VVAIIPDHLVGDGPCQICDAVNVRWWTESEFWNNVVAEWKGEPWSGYDPGGIFCIPCFVIMCDAVGYDVPVWELRPAWKAVRR